MQADNVVTNLMAAYLEFLYIYNIYFMIKFMIKLFPKYRI